MFRIRRMLRRMFRRRDWLIPEYAVLKNEVRFFLWGNDGEVVDFWSCLFQFNRAATGYKTVAPLHTKIAAHMRLYMEYANEHEPTVRLTAFSNSLVGVVRPMLVYTNKRATANIYFHFIDDLLYISLRTIYKQPFSSLKIKVFRLMVLAITLFLQVGNMLSDPSTNGYPYEMDIPHVLTRILTGERLDETLYIAALVTIALTFLGGSISWWRTGKFFGFLREDFNELYRDDVASIGQTAYLAIIRATDELSMKALLPNDDQPVPPMFGNADGRKPQVTRRKSRI